MLKTISAALLAVSVLAAPAIAASTAKTAQVPVAKSATAAAQVKKDPLNANAKMSRRHHVRHHGHHSFHKKMVGKFHKSLKVSAKPVKHPAKRG
jgi:Ni/Co efflux regulator RcnB